MTDFPSPASTTWESLHAAIEAADNLGRRSNCNCFVLCRTCKVLKLYRARGWQLPEKIADLYLPMPDAYKPYRLSQSGIPSSGTHTRDVMRRKSKNMRSDMQLWPVTPHSESECKFAVWYAMLLHDVVWMRMCIGTLTSSGCRNFGCKFLCFKLLETLVVSGLTLLRSWWRYLRRLCCQPAANSMVAMMMIMMMTRPLLPKKCLAIVVCVMPVIICSM